jgi:protein-disulfide isomerase
MTIVTRRMALLGALAPVLAACSGGAKPTPGPLPDDMSLGNPAAKVTVVEYASVACPVCGRWYKEVWPAFKAKYIDTGKVLYVAREALTADPSIAAAGFLTARCAGKDKYFQVVDAIYHAQVQMEAGSDPHAVLLQVARSAGLTDAQFEACIRDQKEIAALNARWMRYVNDDKINATPTFVINGKVYDKGELSMPELDKAVAQAQSAQGKPTT